MSKVEGYFKSDWSMNKINHCIFKLFFKNFKEINLVRSNQSKQPCWRETSTVCRGVQVNAETLIQEKIYSLQELQLFMIY